EAQAKENLAKAEANLKLAKKAVNETFDVAKNHPLLQQPGMQPVRKLLLEKALPLYKGLSQQAGHDPRARAELAEQYFRVGYITSEIGNKSAARRAYAQAEQLCRALLADHPGVTNYRHALALTLTNMGNLLKEEGKRSAALKAYTQARDLLEKLVKDNP